MNSTARAEDIQVSESLRAFLDPGASSKMQMGLARGLAPLAPGLLIEGWAYLRLFGESELKAAAEESLRKFPENALVALLKTELPTWVLAEVGAFLGHSESILEAVLLNIATPDSFVARVAETCSERLAVLIASNQERIIQAPEIVPALERNPHNLKSNTERLRHFLGLAGIVIPGEAPMIEDKPVELAENALDDDEREAEEILKSNSVLTEEERLSLVNYIAKLNVGGKIKLAMKGNKEARAILIRDVNTIVAVSVMKSPKLNEPEVVLYASLRSVVDDVIRYIAESPQWTKSYQIKLALTRNTKTPLQKAMTFLKFLVFKDLQKVGRDRNISKPVQKMAKQMLDLKRK